MAITIDLPPNIEETLLEKWQPDMPRQILEAIAVESYRQEVLTHYQVGILLGFDRWQTDAFLKEHGAYPPYDMEDYEADKASLNRLGF
jgi:hypothetical protein